MIIDTHTHIFPDKIAATAVAKSAKLASTAPNTDGTLHGLEASMKRNGIDYSVVLPVATRRGQAVSINRFAAEVNEGFEKTGILSLAGVHPDDENYKEILNEACSMGFRGIKLHPDYQNTDFDDIKYMRIIDYAASKDLIVVTHAGVDIGMVKINHKVFCTPDMAVRVLDNIDYDRIVLAHMGGWNMWDEAEEKLVGRNCYFDTAFCFEFRNGVARIDDEQFVRICRRHGTDKILFASDSPWGDVGDMVRMVKKTGLTKEEQRLVFSENAAGLFGFNKNKGEII